MFSNLNSHTSSTNIRIIHMTKLNTSTRPEKRAEV